MAIEGYPEAGAVRGLTTRHMPRSVHLGRLLLCSLLCALFWTQAAQAYDRPALQAAACGDGAAEAARLLVAGAADASDDDLGWGRGFVTGVLARTLDCDGGRSPVVSLRNRGSLEMTASMLALIGAPEPAARAAALRSLGRRPEQVPGPLLDRAAATERDPAMKASIAEFAQLADLGSPDMARRSRAVTRLADAPSTRTLTQLTAMRDDPAYATDPAFRQTVEQAHARVDHWLLAGRVLATLYNGLSFASILFMSSVGLAIIFGLMGVINLAQGEFIMLGAYSTYIVQQVVRATAPALAEYYLPLAIIPVFLVTAGIGVALEVGLVRHLYRRPLMSLLATWAVSLFLVNLVRVVFGTQNLQFETPFYVRGGVAVLGDFIITWNRLFAIGFAGAALGGTWLLLRRTGFGLDLRAVTQNRDMAACLGIATRRVDMLAFGLGSGLAGLAGLALSPLYNVNPQMGTTFIIDSFMVVVLGGVAALEGTVLAALGIGQLNVLVEPFYGAVAAKVIVLLLTIAFLQWRPEGLFALQGRRR